MTDVTCRHCGQPVRGQDYYLADLEPDANGIPTNVYVHQACRTGFMTAQARRERLAEHRTRGGVSYVA